MSNLETLNLTITEGINNAQNGAYTILSTEANYKDYEKSYDILKEYFSIDITSDEALNKIISMYDKEKMTFYSSINNFYFPKIDEDTVNTFTQNKTGTNLNIVLNRLNLIDAEIVKLTNEINSNARVLDEKLNKLDRWKEGKVNECNIEATDVHPTSDTIDEPTYQAMIIHAFKKLSVSNTYHYLGRSIKVADSCIHGYKLVNFKSFYENYSTTDIELGVICERYLNFN